MRVPLPAGFDPDRHSGAVVSKVRQAKGPEWSLANIDTEANVAVFRRHVAETTVTAAAKASGSVKTPESFQVSLSAADAKPTMGEKVAATLQDTYPGFYLTDFDPHLARATLTKLDDDTARCRGAVATALGVKPWDVQATPRKGGGYELKLPRSYMPSKHDEKLDEVATSVVGRFGWYVVADANKLTAQIIPSDPPTFPASIPLDMAGLGKDPMRTPFGLKLPKPGEVAHEPIEIDWGAQSWMLLTGTPGSGKAQPLSSRVPVPVSCKFPLGWARIGELELGDLVFAGDGSVVEVDYLSPVEELEVFDVEFTDGQVVQATADHMWVVSTDSSRHAVISRSRAMALQATDEMTETYRQRVEALIPIYCENKVGASAKTLAGLVSRSTAHVRDFINDAGIPFVVDQRDGCTKLFPADEFLQAWLRRLNEMPSGPPRKPVLRVATTAEIAAEDTAYPRGWAVPVAEAIQCPEADLPLPPYALGVWLGDGTKGAGVVSSNPANGDRAWMVEQLRSEGLVNAYASASSKYGINVPGLRAPLRELGVLWRKHIPATYLRASYDQRLALLQGLMDTDGHVRKDGVCVIGLSDERLATGVAELIRSLGIKAGVTRKPNGYTDKSTEIFVKCRDHFNIIFSPTIQVARMPRKAARLASEPKIRTRWNFVAGVHPAGVEQVRCIRVNHPDHTYLTDGFVVTHNTVTINNVIADHLCAGGELYLLDEPAKSLDFLWAKPFVAEGGWGCGGLREAATTLALMYERGKQRAAQMAEMGYVNWIDMPEDVRFKPMLLVFDEVSALLVTDKIPAGIDKSMPEIQELIQNNMLRFRIQSRLRKIMAEHRFVASRALAAQQISNAGTGMPPTMRSMFGHKAQPLTARLPVPISDRFPTGWATIGDLAIGDRVFAEDGEPTQVVSLTPVEHRSVYALRLDDGQVVEADADHIWKISTPNTRSSPDNYPNRVAHRAKLESIAADLRRRAESSGPADTACTGDLAALCGLVPDRVSVLLSGLSYRVEKFAASSGRNRAAYAREVTQFRAGDVATIPDATGWLWRACASASQFDPDALVTVRRLLPDLSADSRGALTSHISAWVTPVLAVDEFDTDRPSGTRQRRVYDMREALDRLASHFQPAEHLPYVIETTEQVARRIERGERCSIKIADAVQSLPADLAFDPYVVGLWLGSGATEGGSIRIGTSPKQVGLDGVADLDWILAQLIGHEASVAGGIITVVGFAGLAGARIPPEYLRSSFDQRMSLLQGLVDAAGSLNRVGSCRLFVKQGPLAEDVCELVRSLGVKARVSGSGRNLHVRFISGAKIATIPRKVARIRPGGGGSGRSNYYTISSVEQVEDADVRCIGVDHPSHMYLTAGFVPTHNCLQGTNPSKTQRTQTFAVESSVPTVPENLIAGGAASKGVGAAELEAQAPAIYKGFYASTESLAAELRRRGVPTTDRPEPTQAEMDEYCPISEEDLDDEGPAFDPRRDAPETFSDDGEQLFGAAAAAAASRRLEAQAKAQRAAKDAGAGTSVADGPRCPSCRAPIRSDGTCEC